MAAVPPNILRIVSSCILECSTWPVLDFTACQWSLWECNVFNHVCVCSQEVPRDHYPWWIPPHYEVPLRHGTLGSLRPGSPPATDIWWSRLETCSNVFTWWTPPPELASCGKWHVWTIHAGVMYPTGVLSFWVYHQWPFWWAMKYQFLRFQMYSTFIFRNFTHKLPQMCQNIPQNKFFWFLDNFDCCQSFSNLVIFNIGGKWRVHLWHVVSMIRV